MVGSILRNRTVARPALAVALPRALALTCSCSRASDLTDSLHSHLLGMLGAVRVRAREAAVGAAGEGTGVKHASKGEEQAVGKQVSLPAQDKPGKGKGRMEEMSAWLRYIGAKQRTASSKNTT